MRDTYISTIFEPEFRLAFQSYRATGSDKSDENFDSSNGSFNDPYRFPNWIVGLVLMFSCVFFIRGIDFGGCLDKIGSFIDKPITVKIKHSSPKQPGPGGKSNNSERELVEDQIIVESGDVAWQRMVFLLVLLMVPFFGMSQFLGKVFRFMRIDDRPSSGPTFSQYLRFWLRNVRKPNK